MLLVLYLLYKTSCFVSEISFRHPLGFFLLILQYLVSQYIASLDMELFLNLLHSTVEIPASSCCRHKIGACDYSVGSWGCRETCSYRRWIGGKTFRWSFLVPQAPDCSLLDTFYSLPKRLWDGILLLDMGKHIFELGLVYEVLYIDLFNFSLNLCASMSLGPIWLWLLHNGPSSFHRT